MCRSVCLLLFGLLYSVTAFPEYKDELPAVPTVNGAAWPGVGHLARGGGGTQNAFGKVRAAAACGWLAAKADVAGARFSQHSSHPPSCNRAPQDLAAAGYTWTAELCRKDSDLDGWSNGQELGDPECKVGCGAPLPRLCVSNQVAAHTHTPPARLLPFKPSAVTLSPGGSS